MPFPTAITERYGSLSGTGFAKENTFGQAVVANTFLPMHQNTLEAEPGWFSPELMMGVRDAQVFNMYGEAKFGGAIGGPLFPSNAMALTAAAIGADAQAGSGVTGSSPASSTTLNGAVAANTTTATLTSVTGYAVGSIVQLDVNATGPTTTAECRKITSISTNTITVDQAWTYAHASGAAVSVVQAPFFHTISEAVSLPSLTIEKNVGSFQSLQFAGCRVNKFTVKTPLGNQPVDLTADVIGQSVAPLSSPTAINITNEIPFIFAEASVSLFGHARAEASNLQIDIENGLKESYTFSNSHGPSFITPVTLKVHGSLDVVWDSFTDSTYGDFTSMENGTLGALTETLQHPSNGGSAQFNLPQVALSKFSNDIKMTDVIMSTLTFEATKPLTGTSLYTIQAVVSNSVYLPY